jgi:hypothetical protein
MANVSKKLAITTAGVALSCVVMEANPAQAAVFTYDFTVTGTENFLLGKQFSGSFSYDDSSPRTSFGGYRPLNFSFDFFGKTYTEANLIVDAGGYGGFFPGQGLETADLSSDNEIFFLRGNGLENGLFFASLEAFPGVQQSGKVTYQLRPPSPPTSVPEPGTVGSLLFLSLSRMFLKRKSIFSKGIAN